MYKPLILLSFLVFLSLSLKPSAQALTIHGQEVKTHSESGSNEQVLSAKLSSSTNLQFGERYKSTVERLSPLRPSFILEKTSNFFLDVLQQMINFLRLPSITTLQLYPEAN